MTRLYLDCDGVLADFDKHAADLLGVTTTQWRQSGRTDAEMWAALQAADSDFFYNLPLMPGARVLVDYCEQHNRPLILSGCPRGGWAEIQKIQWAAKYFPGIPMITCRARDKSLFCRSGDILVDDRDHYADRWVAAGGKFVLHRSVYDTMETLFTLGVH